MAKYKLLASMITPLTDAGYIDGGGAIKLRVPTREQGQSEQMFEMTWTAASEALQTSNKKGMTALKNTASTPQKFNDQWKVTDPALPWFEELPDADPTPAKVVNGTDGVEVLAKWERTIIRNYCAATSQSVPDLTQTKADLQTILSEALAYYGRS